MEKRQKPEVGKSYRTTLVPEMRSVDEKARTITFTASDESVDRYGDVIRVAGWDYQNYLKNPVFMWAHRSGDPPIGKCVDLRIEANPPALVQTIEFADAATYPFAETIFRLYREGYMRAVSVGFMPTEQPKPITDLEGHFSGYEFTGQELLELSATPIPANPQALARAIQKGFAQSDLDRAFSGEVSTMSLEDFHRELASISMKIADIALDVATEKVKEVIATLKTRQQSAEICTIEQLCDAVKQAGAATVKRGLE